MAKYICSVCGYVYDEEKGIPEAGINPGTKWEDLPENWVCPLCGATKAEFTPENVKHELKPTAVKKSPVAAELKELSAAEVSAVCSNLAKGCEKQYKTDEAELFTFLAESFEKMSPKATGADFEKLAALIDEDLNNTFVECNDIAKDSSDRGAMRALVWSEKVTRVQKSLLARYLKEGEAMLENTGVYVCTVCGFIYVGDEPPALCPVCKVPAWKFEKVEGGEQ